MSATKRDVPLKKQGGIPFYRRRGRRKATNSLSIGLRGEASVINQAAHTQPQLPPKSIIEGRTPLCKQKNLRPRAIVAGAALNGVRQGEKVTNPGRLAAA